MTHSEIPTSELEALRELEELKVQEVDGEPLTALLALAQSREKALASLHSAHEVFREGLDKSSYEKMEEAFSQADGALKTLQQISYPDTPLFAARRAALAADIARGRALLAAIDTWWWQCFAQAIAEVYANLKTLDQARNSLQKAEEIWKRWPDSTVESGKPGAKTTLDTARSEVDNLAVRQFGALFDETEKWIALAEEILPKDGEAALQCLVHAEATYAAAERSWDGIETSQKNLFEKDPEGLTRSLDETKQKITKGLFETMAKRRNAESKKRFEKWMEDYRREAKAAEQAGSDWAWLLSAEGDPAKGLRQRLNDLIFLLEPNPDLLFELADDLQDVIRERKTNVQRSADLLSQVQWATEPSRQALGYNGRTDHSTVYYRWRRLREAHSLDPDNEKIADLLREAKRAWEGLKGEVGKRFRDIAGALEQIRQQIAEIEAGKKVESAPADVDDLAAIEKRLEETSSNMAKAKKQLDELKGDLQRHLEFPPEWQEQLSRLEAGWKQQNSRLNDLKHKTQVVQKLIEDWRAPHDLEDLIARTQGVCESNDLPPKVRQAGLGGLLEAVRSALPGIRNRRPQKAGQVKLTWLLWQLRSETAGPGEPSHHSTGEIQ